MDNLTRYITTPHEAELNAERVMRGWGFVDAKATTGGPDGGIDVRSSQALAQVKWRGGVAGRPDIQKLYGARGGDAEKALFFFSASGYSRAAVDYARENGIGLYVYDPLGHATPVTGEPAQVALPVKPTADWSAVGFWLLLTLGLAVSLVLLAIVMFDSDLTLNLHQ